MTIDFGKRIKAIREEKGMTLEEMAAYLETTKQALSRYERGERTPKITIAAKFAEKLGLPLKELVGVDGEEAEEEKPEPPKTIEAQILARGIDKLSQEQREQALAVVRAMFAMHADYFEKGTDEE